MKRLLIPLFSIALWWSAAAQDKAQSDGGWWNENPSLVLPIRAVGVTGVKPMKEIGVQKTQLDTLVLHENIALSMADVLTFNSSIFIKQYGRATLSTVAFRGTGPSHTQVVWNGMRINSPMLGMTDFSMIPSYFVDDAQAAARHLVGQRHGRRPGRCGHAGDQTRRYAGLRAAIHPGHRVILDDGRIPASSPTATTAGRPPRAWYIRRPPTNIPTGTTTRRKTSTTTSTTSSVRTIPAKSTTTELSATSTCCRRPITTRATETGSA